MSLKQLYLDFLISASFQGVNSGLFVLSFENEDDRTGYYLPNVEIKDYNVKTDGRNFFDQPINDDIKTYENTGKIATGQGDDCTTDFLLDYHCSKENYKVITIDLRKQQGLDADPRAIQQINFAGNLDLAGNITMFFIYEEGK